MSGSPPLGAMRGSVVWCMAIASPLALAPAECSDIAAKSQPDQQQER
eukprot:gene38823-47945_t